jgi:curved DNA-binding protein CbpA
MGSASDHSSGDLYTLLGLKPSASDDEIRNAYYELAKVYHPDGRRQDPKAKEAFRAIARAAAILRDPEQRRLYDRSHDSGSRLLAQHRTQRKGRFGRAAVVFLSTLVVTAALGTGLSLVVLRRMSQAPSLAGNSGGRAATSEVVDASHLPAEAKGNTQRPHRLLGSSAENPASETKVGQLQPLSSDKATLRDLELEVTTPGQDSASSSSALEGPRKSQFKEEETVPFFPEEDRRGNLAESPSQHAGTFGFPAFDISKGKGTSSKSASARKSKPRPEECSLTVAARALLVHVSAAIKAK